MRRSALALITVCAALVPGAAAVARDVEGAGLSPKREHAPASGWQGRIAIGSTLPALPVDGVSATDAASGSRISGLSLVGDYYFGIAPRWAGGGGGGLRASGGVLWGSRIAWSGVSSFGGARNGLVVERQWSGAAADGADAATLPYLGVGYSGLLGSSRFGFSADVGLVAQRPGQAVRLGRVFGGSQSLDDAVRELRLAPVLQLGVSYAF